MTSVVLTISGRTMGGEEVLVSKLLRLYTRYAESQGWQMESIPPTGSSTELREKAATLIQGQDAYRKLRYENGVHRVQWVPTNEQQGRVFTAKLAVSVARLGRGQQERAATDIGPARTYNLPQYRVTDHRIGLTLNQFDLDTGELEPIVQALIAHFDGAGSDDGSVA